MSAVIGWFDERRNELVIVDVTTLEQLAADEEAAAKRTNDLTWILIAVLAVVAIYLFWWAAERGAFRG